MRRLRDKDLKRTGTGAGVAVGQIYGSLRRGKGKPNLRIKILRVDSLSALFEILGPLEGEITPDRINAVKVGMRGTTPLFVLGNEDHPLLEDV